MIVDGEIRKLEQNIAVMDEGLKVVAEAFKALDEYESSEKEPTSPSQTLYINPFSATSSSGW